MRFSSLIIFLNNICPVGCETCNVSARPDNRDEISVSDIDLVLKETIAQNHTNYVIWTGGEPFYNREKLKTAVIRADQFGFRSEILTSGFYIPSKGYFDKFADNSNLSVRISLDAEHNRVVKYENVLELAAVLINKGIEVNFTVRNIPAKKFVSREFFDLFRNSFPDYYKKRAGDSRWVHHIPHIPLFGKDQEDLSNRNLGKKGCGFVFRDIVIGWDARIYPCCGLFSLPNFEKLSAGRITQGFFSDPQGKVKKMSQFTEIRSNYNLRKCYSCHRFLKELV